MSLATVKLSNDVEMPSLGFGCAFGNWTGQTEYQGFLPEEAWVALPAARRAGFSHFDMAKAYGTQKHARDALLQPHFAAGGKRDELFLATKICHPDAPPHVAIPASGTFNMDTPGLDVEQKTLDDFNTCLSELGVGYVDLLMMHWPGRFGSESAEENRALRKRAWSVFEAIYKRGQARAIGVCNFSVQQLKDLVTDGTVAPMVNQIEVSPYCANVALVEGCQAIRVQVVAYAPFGSGGIGLMQDATLKTIAEKYGKDTGQLVLRWLLQRGCAAMPKSSNERRMAGNLNVHDFIITDEDMVAISSLDCGKRSCPDPAAIP